MTEDSTSEPVRRIDDATYGTPPENPAGRQLLRTKRWFLLDANRWVVTGVLLCGTFVAIVLVGAFGPVSVDSFLTEGVSPGSALVELLKAIVSVVVIVLSINQLVLSPGLGPVGEQRERYEQSMDLRRKVEDHTGVRVSPSSPGAFLSVLVDAIADQAEELERATAGAGDRDLEARTGEFRRTVVGEATEVGPLLSDGRFGEFDVVSAALRFPISGKVRTLRDIRQAHDGTLPDPAANAFDEMGELLELFTVAREYLKTVYLREEYIDLSEGLLYTGLPAIVVTFLASQIYAPTVFPGQVLGVDRRLLFVGGAMTVALTPFVFLISYISRLAAMSRSTLFVGPFDARSTEEDRSEPATHGR